LGTLESECECNEALFDENMNSDRLEFTVDNEDVSSELDIRDKLANWSVKHNVTQVATTELLHILGKDSDFDLPKDARTLLKTPRTAEIVAIGDGQFVYFGIIGQVRNKIASGFRITKGQFFKSRQSQFGNFVSISVGIDGLPISRSSNKQFWPIIGKVDQSVDQKPFLIGLYFGISKPCSLKLFLKDFVEECLILQEIGITIGEIRHEFLISSFICDAPARSFVKQVKNHNSYNGCERCVQEGSYLGRVVFSNLNAVGRDNNTFRNSVDADHHTGDSPLLQLKLDLVSQFPLDYMHCVCLGVVRKLLYSWIKGPLKTRLLPRNIKLISENLQVIKRYIPSEFVRKPRSLRELDHFKATEFRLFLLYTSPIVMEPFLSKTIYKNLLILHCAMYILLSEYADHPEWNEFTKKLLVVFVQQVSDIYGVEFLSYNMHCLIHLADDAKLYGKLDNVSAFPFENFMQTLKRNVRSKSSQLKQVFNRVQESVQLVQAGIPNNNVFSIQNEYFHVSSNVGDNCFLSKAFSIVLVVGIDSSQGDDESKIVSKVFLTKSSVKHYPIDSRSLHMYKVSGLSEERVFRRHDFLRKCVLIPVSTQNDEFMCIPML
jgi:hypothetical protein